MTGSVFHIAAAPSSAQASFGLTSHLSSPLQLHHYSSLAQPSSQHQTQPQDAEVHTPRPPRAGDCQRCESPFSCLYRGGVPARALPQASSTASKCIKRAGYRPAATGLNIASSAWSYTEQQCGTLLLVGAPIAAMAVRVELVLKSSTSLIRGYRASFCEALTSLSTTAIILFTTHSFIEDVVFLLWTLP